MKLTMESNKNVRGGRRPGAGRKISGTGKRVTLSARVDPVTLSEVKKIAKESGYSIGQVLDSFFNP